MKSITQVVESLIKPYIDSHDRAAEAIIAPVETDATSASDDYAVGKQLILNNVLYDVIAPITTGDALVVNTNIKASDNVSSDIEALTNQVTDISEVMGKNGAKNKEPFDIDVVKALNTTGTWTGNSYALNGITFAFADDGKVTVSGTASALCSINISGNYDLNGDYIITGCPSGGGGSTYSLRIYDSSATVVADDIGEGISFTANNLANCRTNIIVRKDVAISTPIVFAPMLRDSKDPDATYQPYAKTNQELTAENQTLSNQVTDISDEIADMNNVLGAKNLLPNNAVTITRDNVTYTVNPDKTVNVETGSGGASQQTGIMVNTKFSSLSAGDYILSDGESNGVQLYINCFDNNDTFIKQIAVCQNGAEVKFTVDYDGYTYMSIGFAILGGEEVNTICSPMIRPATIKDGTYKPYAMTNQKLTDLAIKTDIWTIQVTTTDNQAYYDAYGEYGGNASIATATGYSYEIWSKRIAAIVLAAYDASDGSVIYNASAGDTVKCSSFKPSRTVVISILVLYR